MKNEGNEGDVGRVYHPWGGKVKSPLGWKVRGWKVRGGFDKDANKPAILWLMAKSFDLDPGRKIALHAIVLGSAVIVTLFWVINEKLAFYSLQLSGGLLLTLVITHRILKPPSFRLVESTISTMAVLLVTQATGGIASPLFFLNYFLLFELSLLLEAIIPMILSVFLIFFYFITNDVAQSPFLITALLAFPTMTPLAYYFGRTYHKEENQKKELRNLSKKVVALEEELVEEELRK